MKPSLFDRSTIRSWSIIAISFLLCWPVRAQFHQQGEKLAGAGAVGKARQGTTVAISADGNSMVIGGPDDNNGFGSAWVFVRNDDIWSQQGGKLVGSGTDARVLQGSSIAMSADGNTVLIGGPGDSYSTGASWVFIRSGDTWVQQGPKLVGTGATYGSGQGSCVALSGDGNTALIGGPGDSVNVGAAWVFVRSDGAWIQQGQKLVGAGAEGRSREGNNVALSQDGATAIIAGSGDGDYGAGAVWIFVRMDSGWSQQGPKLFIPPTVEGEGASYGSGVDVSGDGNTLIVGASTDSGLTGSAWVYVRNNGVWSHQGGKLLPSDIGYHSGLGKSVSISADGNTAVIGGSGDESTRGAVWVYDRVNDTWLQKGPKLVGAGGSWNARQGSSVAISDDGSTFVTGAWYDNEGDGAVWVFSDSGRVVLPELPATPILASPSDSATEVPRTVQLWWHPSSRAAGYDVQLGTDPSFAAGVLVSDTTTTDTVRVVEGLSYGRTYHWRVRAVNAGGTGAWSGPFRFLTLAKDPTIPLQVYPPSGMKGLDTAITLSWNRLPGYAEGTVGFILEVGGDSSLTPGPSTRTVATIDTSVVLHSLDFLTAHWWRVKSRFESGSESPYSPSWVFSTGLPMPGSVALLHPESDVVVNRDTLVFNWRRVGPLVTRYWLEYSIDSAFTVKGVVSMLTDTTATIAGLVKSMSYHWRVRAGNASGWGAFSPPRVFLRSALAVDDKSIPLPETWVLEQNYPNPFNPSTTIRYGAPAAAHVSLTLFNTLGQQVAVLQDGDREAGYHEVQFDAHGLPSGVYFYRILVRPSDSVLGRDSRGGAGGFVQTKRLVLLR